MARAKSPIPEGFSTVTPVLVHEDMRKAIEWYEKALGAESQGGISEDPDGKVLHSVIRVGEIQLLAPPLSTAHRPSHHPSAAATLDRGVCR